MSVCRGHGSHPSFGVLPNSLQVAHQQIKALRSEVSELRVAFRTCLEMNTNLSVEKERSLQDGCCACPSSTSINTTLWDSNWNVEVGDCMVKDDCVVSPHYPEQYGAGERCVITIEPNWTGVLDLQEFDVQKHVDYLTVNGASYSDPYLFTKMRLQGRRPVGIIEWASTSNPAASLTTRRWRLCRTAQNLSTKPKDQVLWSVAEGLCEVDVDGCLNSPNFPDTYNSSRHGLEGRT